MLFWLAVITLILTLFAALDLFSGNRRVVALRELPPAPGNNLPPVSVVVAARNEQRNLREALQSLLTLDYPSLELIVVNDRSEDDTGRILAEAAARDSRLQVVTVETLPPGWLGKNHALWAGSHRAKGELLLFTDADIVMEPTVLTRAVKLMQARELAHLALTPAMRMPTAFLGMFGAAFIVIFSLFTRPWKARDPASRHHIGIGAFNLVSAAAYQRVGGHATISLRPDDDIKLGKIIKLAGLRQDVAFAPEFLTVEWYASVGEVIRGLEKNAFAGADYNIPLVLFGALGQVCGSIWPFVALLCTHGWTRALYLVVALLIMVIVADSGRFHRSCPWLAVGYPLASLLFVYILLRTMLLNLIQGGIRWRGTFYPLEELRANRV